MFNNYSEVIQNNQNCATIKWWTKYAFHYTDITNAINIIKTEKLYSRIKAEESHLMKNDNASSQVIDMTISGAQSFVRFYFRPLTPTQYYNEGFKHKQLRYDGDLTANTPVPIFFVFNLEKLLSTGKVKFSNFSQAGGGSVLYEGVEGFQNLNFDKIYSEGYADEDVLKYRHAEILYPEEYPINQSLEFIVCRNEIEKQTLLNLLRETDYKAYFTYKNKIKICKDYMFEKNGLFVNEINYYDNRISIVFADTFKKLDYQNRMLKKQNLLKMELSDVSVSVLLEWKNKKSTILHKNIEFLINYLNPSKITFKNIPIPEKAKTLVVKIFIEGHIVAFVSYNLGDTEII